MKVDIESSYFPLLHSLEDIVGRILLLLKLRGNSPQYFPEDVVKQPKGELVLKVDDTIIPVTKYLTHQGILPQLLF